MKIKATHKKFTDEEQYQYLKRNKDTPYFMDAEEWKKLRLEVLKKERRVWSK